MPGERQRACLACPLPYLLAMALPVLVHLPALLGLAPAERTALYAGLEVSPRPAIVDGLGALDPNAGLTVEALGALAAHDWLRGEVPWWNPYSGVGLPLAAEMQPAALFLPFNLLLAGKAGPLHLKLLLQCLAAALTCGLARLLGLGWREAATAGAVYACAGEFAWFDDAPIMPLAFLPALLLGIEYVTDRRPWPGVPIIAVSVAYSIYAGFPETAYLDGLLAVAWSIARLARPNRLRLGVRLMWGALAGVALALPILLPFVQLLQVGYSGHESGSGFGERWDVLALPAAGWPVALFPTIYGPLAPSPVPGEPSPFVNLLGGPFGCALLAGAVAGVRGRRERAIRIALVAFLAVCAAFIVAVPGITHLARLIPLVGVTLVPRYVISACALCGALLAGFALDDWRRGEAAGRIVTPLIWIALTTTPLLAASGTLWRSLTLGRPAWTVSALALGLGLGAVFLRVRARPWHPAWAATASLCLAVEAGYASLIPALSGPIAATDRAAPRWLRDRLGLQRFYTLGPIRPNYGAFYGVAQLNSEYRPIPDAWLFHIEQLDPTADIIQFRGYEPPPAEQHIAALTDRLDRYREDGVRYIVAPPDAKLTVGELVYRDGHVAIRELPDPKPYWEAQGCAIEQATRLATTLDCATSSTLLRRELAYPGWTATVGEIQATVQAEGIFQTVPVPAGRSAIRFSYAPPHIAWACAAALAGLASLGPALRRNARLPTPNRLPSREGRHA